MPILPAEPDMHPVDLLDSADGGGPWWALYTLARREKELMRRLLAADLAFYSPLIPHRSRSPGGRTRVSFLPLFPSYVFLRGDEGARHAALATNCVSRWLPVPDPHTLVFDLQQIHRLVSSHAPLTAEARLEPGRPVRVRSGPMLGMEGTVVERRGKDWLIVALRFLQQGVSVMLEDFQIEPI